MNGDAPNILRKRRRSRLWHRWVGFIVVVPLLFVSLSGALLNHSRQLGLDERHVADDWLLSRYGMELKGDPVTYVAGGGFVSGWNGQLFWNGAPLDSGGSLKGVVELAIGIAVAQGEALLILDSAGSLVEELGDESLPPGCCDKAGKTEDGRLVLRTEDGESWTFAPDLLGFSSTNVAPVEWSKPVTTDDPLRQSMARSYRGDGLTWSRVLMDLHSGRFFGPVGRWVVDLTVFLLVGLAVTGVVLGFRTLKAGCKDKDEREVA